jgi:hypothetical protein
MINYIFQPHTVICQSEECTREHAERILWLVGFGLKLKSAGVYLEATADQVAYEDACQR